MVTLESRATYGYSKNVMREMQNYSELDLATLVTGMHLMPEFGLSMELIEQDGFPVSAAVPLAPDGDGVGAWSRAMGEGIAGFSEALLKLSPDIVLLSGDRAETLALCVAAAYMGIPIAHIQAGDKSGHIDDAARYAIAKLAHIHLASCEDSAERLIKLGEQEFRIFNVGAPQLDDMTRDFSATSITHDDVEYSLEEPYILLLQHPVMAEKDDVQRQMQESVEACLSSDLRLIWIYPNSDLGYRDIISVIDDYRDHRRVTLFNNLNRDKFLTLLYNAEALVGNSSSGVLEAPSFRVPVVNIGNRQRGRPQASNILNCEHDRGAIVRTLNTALKDDEFRRRRTEAVNPYGDGQSSPRICKVLGTIPIDHRLMDKETTF